jgi:protein-S-isoprenylcysteine O-methyltransferase Ste14
MRSIVLVVTALRNVLLTAAMLGVLIFVPAGTLAYWQGWLASIVILVAITATGLYLAVYDPALLARRKKFGPANEARPAQKIIIWLALVATVAVPVVSALDHRFAWSNLPAFWALVGAALTLAGFLIQLLVFRANTYGSSTIEIVPGQTVIATGPYAIVRHPMYVGIIVMLAGLPLALGSLWGLVFLAIQIPVLVWRILDEEALLIPDLPGYAQYAARVRYRLVPGIW